MGAPRKTIRAPSSARRPSALGRRVTLRPFGFAVVTLDAQGREAEHRRGHAQQFSEHLGKRAILHIPTAGPELTQAINQGRPLALHQPKSPVGRALQAVADQVRTRIDDRAVRR